MVSDQCPGQKGVRGWEAEGTTESRESNGCAQAKQAPSLKARRPRCLPGGSMSPDSLTSFDVLRLPLAMAETASALTDTSKPTARDWNGP